MISTVKLLTVKNKTRQKAFSEIGIPPSPIVTRWGSWLLATTYYLKYLPKVKEIVEQFDGGILVENAKKALLNDSLAKDLVTICTQYSNLIEIIEKIESTSFSIMGAHRIIRVVRVARALRENLSRACEMALNVLF